MAGTSQNLRTISSCPTNSFCYYPANHIRIFLSWLPVMVIPLGKVSAVTAWECPVRVSLHFPVSTSHILAVPSHDPVTISSLTAYETLFTAYSCPLNSIAGLPSASISMTLLSLPAEKNPVPPTYGHMSRTCPSWYFTSLAKLYFPIALFKLNILLDISIEPDISKSP